MLEVIGEPYPNYDKHITYVRQGIEKLTQIINLGNERVGRNPIPVKFKIRIFEVTCTQNLQIPDLCGAGECRNTIGSFVCRCPDGYSVKPEQGPACTDDDECELGTCDCHPAADCINLPVSDTEII